MNLLTNGTPHAQNRPPHTWAGLPVHDFKGNVTEIFERIPIFERRPFRLDGSSDASLENRFHDLIVRCPDKSQPKEIPVALVSKRYGLLQHRAVAKEAVKSTEAAGIDPGSLVCSLSLTEHGERMALFLQLPIKYEFDPGDGYPMTLRLCCYNSVDGHSGLVAHIGWYRFVCSNGMFVGVTKSRFRRVHDHRAEIGEIGLAFTEGVQLAAGEKSLFQKWINRSVSEERLRGWVDGRLTKAWGVKAATRAFHIAEDGHDVALADPFEKAPASRRKIKQGNPVPGALFPARNAYGISQVLSWLARERHEVEDQLQRTREIPVLMRRLLN